MSQRVHNITKWLWCLLILYSGPSWNPVRCVAARAPPSNPSAIETQAKFFQDFFSVQLSPYKIEFGHVCEDPNTWEQRYEKKDFKNHRDMGKIRWGDKKGGYGEHYWDLNHAGHTADHGDDDGSYRERDSEDSYEEPSDQSANYDTINYNLENTEQHDDSSREKRAPKKIRTERAQETDKEQDDAEKPQFMRKPVRKQKEQKEGMKNDTEEEESDNQEVSKKPAKTQQKRPQKELNEMEENKPTKDKNQVVLVVDEKEKEEKPMRYVQRHPEAKVFVPYEGGAGVRQHYQAEIAPAASIPRLFLEPATGHVVDRATGQAYVLQPINRNPSFS